jgi:pilus assembly protein CpaF
MADLDEATKSVLDAVAGFGPLQQHLDDVTIEEIWIQGRPTPGLAANVTVPVSAPWRPARRQHRCDDRQ